MEKPYKNLRKRQFSNSSKNSLAGRIDKILHLGTNFNAESEFGIHFVSGLTVTTSLVLMSRTDFENSVIIKVSLNRYFFVVFKGNLLKPTKTGICQSLLHNITMFILRA